MADVSIDPAHTAGLSMDLQAGVVSVSVKAPDFIGRVQNVLVAFQRTRRPPARTDPVARRRSGGDNAARCMR